jgi:valyl-tRNA synthetase
MPKSYDPQAVEASWFARWEEAGLFRADARSTKPKFSMALPPPNVTGELHTGHALQSALYDMWARYRRMTGFEVLWLPGTDHAAISTQNVIERQLAEEGTTKEELGRERFNERVEAWYGSVGATIIDQFKELGASLDYSRLRFTMDPAYVRAVRTAFVRFWEKGWLYRGPRIVNWCPRCLSAISDLEVDWQEHQDTLYFIRYPIEDEPGESVTIATVRPETMLADTGVAVHPGDPRYTHLVGMHAILPLVGRRLPIVADEAVDREFGTGALKVTPGHDAMDWEVGQRHGLELINGMHLDGRMNVPDLPAYDGLPGVEARALVVRDLEAGGFIVETQPYTHMVGHCDRCGSIIEPLVSEQWFMKMGPMAENAIAASARGEVRWHPERYERTYLDWLGGIRDWCVSRQLWLGHRIPVYTCDNGHRFASVDEPVSCPECGSRVLEQDPDVLDTWFSSALWPFATLGWPDDTEDLRTFYPTDLNATAREIINLWVSRMIMTGLEFMGAVPFGDVAVHGVVQTADGQRMSKSKGNVIDPREIIRRYGADALRAWGAAVAMSSQDVRFDESRIEGFRRFCNKLWNATRLVLDRLGEDSLAVPAPDADLHFMDRWILARLQATIEAATRGIEEFAPQIAINAIYDFAWHDYCDWYLEAIKARLRDGDPAARAVAVQVLDILFRLLHPFMPFVTEELWSRLPGNRRFIMLAGWPKADPRFAAAADDTRAGRVMAVVEEIRRLRPASPGKRLPAPQDPRISRGPRERGRIKLEAPLAPDIAELVGLLGEADFVDELTGPGLALTEVAGRVEFPTRAEGPVGGLDHGVQRAARDRLVRELERSTARLASGDFVAKAPAAVVEKERARLTELRDALERLDVTTPN